MKVRLGFAPPPGVTATPPSLPPGARARTRGLFAPSPIPEDREAVVRGFDSAAGVGVDVIMTWDRSEPTPPPAPKMSLQQAVEVVLEQLYPGVPLEGGQDGGMGDADTPFDLCDSEEDEAGERDKVRTVLLAKLPPAMFRNRRRHSIDISTALPGANPQAGGAANRRKPRSISVSDEPGPAPPAAGSSMARGGSAGSSSGSDYSSGIETVEPGSRVDPALLQSPVTLDAVHKALFQRVLARSTARVRYEDPRLTSLRAKLLQRVFEHVPASRVHLCRSLAETTFDYMDMFLRELKSASDPHHHRPTSPRGAGGGVSPKAVGPGDGSVLAELLCTYVQVVASACREVCHDTMPAVVEGLTKQTEMLTMAVVHLCRARPTLDSHFDALVQCIHALVQARPHVATNILKRLLSSWPRLDSTREVTWVLLVQNVLLCCPAPTVCNARLHRPIMKQLIKSLGSLHAAVARQALELLSNMYVTLHYVLPYPDLSAAVRTTLVANRKHWNHVVVQMSDQQFENMLDLAA